jgi:hypothetical protein
MVIILDAQESGRKLIILIFWLWTARAQNFEIS